MIDSRYSIENATRGTMSITLRVGRTDMAGASQGVDHFNSHNLILRGLEALINILLRRLSSFQNVSQMTQS